MMIMNKVAMLVMLLKEALWGAKVAPMEKGRVVLAKGMTMMKILNT